MRWLAVRASFAAACAVPSTSCTFASTVLMRAFTRAICSSTYSVVAHPPRFNPPSIKKAAVAGLFAFECIFSLPIVWSLMVTHQARVPMQHNANSIGRIFAAANPKASKFRWKEIG